MAQSTGRLNSNGAEYRGSDVGLGDVAGNEILDVGFGEDTAAGGNGVSVCATLS